MAKKVSVVVCSYNAADALTMCLKSLEKQGYGEKEIIIVNDASTDHTSDVLRQFRTTSAIKVNVIFNEENLGVAGSRNIGIRHATGDIIAFTDADCVPDSEWVSELVKGYHHDGVVAVGGSIIDTPISNIWQLVTKGHDFVAREEGYVSYVQGCNMSFDANVLRQFMFNDEIKYGYEEALLCDYLITAGHKIYYRPQAVVHHKHRTNLFSLLKQKYLRGVSSIWYRKKRNKPFMFKRHLVLLSMFLLIPFCIMNMIAFYFWLLLFLVFSLSLLRDELIFGKKTIKEIIITFPLLIVLELSHFWGSLAGLIKFRVSPQNRSKKINTR